jgi:hypothetical protein
MKKTVLIWMLGLLTTVQVAAQREGTWWTVIPKVGLNLANMSMSDIYIGTSDDKMSGSTKLGLALGIEAEYHNGWVGLSAGLLYSQQGTRYDDAPQTWKDQKLSLQYLNIPVLFHGYATPQLGLEVGLQPGFMIGKKLSGEAYGIDGAYHSFSETDLYYRSFDIGIPVGVTYDLGPVRLGFRYTFGVYDTTKVKMKERNKVAQLTIGYRFDL